jgi:hypothetical protein
MTQERIKRERSSKSRVNGFSLKARAISSVPWTECHEMQIEGKSITTEISPHLIFLRSISQSCLPYHLLLSTWCTKSGAYGFPQDKIEDKVKKVRKWIVDAFFFFFFFFFGLIIIYNIFNI